MSQSHTRCNQTQPSCSLSTTPMCKIRNHWRSPLRRIVTKHPVVCVCRGHTHTFRLSTHTCSALMLPFEMPQAHTPCEKCSMLACGTRGAQRMRDAVQLSDCKVRSPDNSRMNTEQKQQNTVPTCLNQGSHNLQHNHAEHPA